MSPILRKLNGVVTPPALLGRVAQFYAALPASDHDDHDRRMLKLLAFLRSEHLAPPTPLLALALDLRLKALRRLAEESGLPGWHGPVPANDLPAPVLEVAATEPLERDPEGLACFDAAPFRRRLLS